MVMAAVIQQAGTVNTPVVATLVTAAALGVLEVRLAVVLQAVVVQADMREMAVTPHLSMIALVQMLVVVVAVVVERINREIKPQVVVVAVLAFLVKAVVVEVVLDTTNQITIAQMELGREKAVQAVPMAILAVLMLVAAHTVAAAVICVTTIFQALAVLVRFVLFGALTERSRPLIQEIYNGTLH
jgi:hypothetical protein